MHGTSRSHTLGFDILVMRVLYVTHEVLVMRMTVGQYVTGLAQLASLMLRMLELVSTGL